VSIENPTALRAAQTSERTRTGVNKIHARGCGWQSGRCKCGRRLRFQAAVWSPKDGKRIRKHFKTMKAATDWRDESKGAIRKRIMRAPTTTTVAEAADKLIADMRSGDLLDRSGKPYKPSAVRAYETSLRLRITPRIGHVKLSSLDREEHVQPLVDEWRREGILPSTVRNQLNPLQVIARRAIKAHVLIVNPTTGLDLPMGKGRRTRVADPAEAAELIAALPSAEKAIFATAFYAGLRLGELRALRVSDVDFKAGAIRVERSYDPIAHVIDVKSAAGKREVPLLAALRPILEERKGDRIGDALLLGRGADKPFITSNIYNHARKAWAAENEKRIEKANINNVELLAPIGLHECRHTFASLLIAAGVNAKTVSVALGHANIAITMDVYGHLLPGAGDEVADVVNAYLARPALTAVGS
jgi:integrase